MNPGPASRPRALLPVAAACFFLSGVAALLYEVVWTRLLGVVFGHTVYAITTVLATYMAGLALGSVLLGRRADRVERPLRAYAFLEAAVGAFCLATPLLFRAADAGYLWAHRVLRPGPAGSIGLHLALAVLLLLPPTTLMGATLPILSRAVASASSGAARRVGVLYAVNTWGAVAGTLAAGFFLLPALGQRATIAVGVSLNAAVAAAALLLDRAGQGVLAVPAPPGELPSRRAGQGVQTAVALFAIGVSGAASMACEVAWTRALSLVLGSSTYAFSAMLSAFLAGLALGALLASRWMARRRPGLLAFSAAEAAIALSVAATVPLLGALPEAVLAVLRHTGVSWASMLATQFGLALLVMIVPTVLFGATFPLAVAALERGLERLGRDVGTVYAANTLGTIAGSAITGFLLIRTLGIQHTLRVAAAANLAAAVALVAASRPGRRACLALAGAAGIFAALVFWTPRWSPLAMSSGPAVYADTWLRGGPGALREGRELLFYDEGISTTVAVMRDPDGTTLSVNGKVDASNDLDMVTQIFCGHLGLLLHPEARRVLVVGLASAVTVGAVLQHPVEKVDVAELEPAMLGASRFFLAENRDALADPRVRVIEGDGRSILATAAEPYDLVVSEPSNPWIAGVASLFTVEFYRAARGRLAEGGVFVQWLQGYSISSRDMQMVVRTLQEVFPHVSVWSAGANDYLLVGSEGLLPVDLSRVARMAAASPGLREDMARFHFGGEELAFRVFLGEEDARRYGAGAPLNTDDLPRLEFSAPRALLGASASANEERMRSFRSGDWAPLANASGADLSGAAAHLRAARASWLGGRTGEARYQTARAAAAPASGRDRVELGRMLFVLGDFDAAFDVLSAASPWFPDDAAAQRYLRAAAALREPTVRRELEARLSNAGSTLTSALSEVFLGLARVRGNEGFLEIALEQLAVEAEMRPGSSVAFNNLAGGLYQAGRLEDAAAALRTAVRLHPGIADTRFNLGLVLDRLGQPAQAAAEYQAALTLNPSWDKPRLHLASLRRAAPGLLDQPGARATK